MARRVICLSCISDEDLREKCRELAEPTTCAYCQKEGLCITVGALAEIADQPLRSYCCHGEEYPVPELGSDRYRWEEHGDPLEWFLQEELGIDVNPAADLIQRLEEGDSDGFFDTTHNFGRRPIDSLEYECTWSRFRHRVCRQRRFFDEVAKGYLSEILGCRGSEKAKGLPTRELGPASQIEGVYSARLADSKKGALSISQEPEVALGPPPDGTASAGRMNPAGISVFYGALSEDTCIAEVRPSVGSLVVVGRFRPDRTLCLLDLTEIGNAFPLSIFQCDYEERAAHRRFLEGFHSLIAMPVLPHDELIEYVPTQAVAEYVTSELGFDGMLYASAQLGSIQEQPALGYGEPPTYAPPTGSSEGIASCNVVLTGAAGRVATKAAVPERKMTQQTALGELDLSETMTRPGLRQSPLLVFCTFARIASELCKSPL